MTPLLSLQLPGWAKDRLAILSLDKTSPEFLQDTAAADRHARMYILQLSARRRSRDLIPENLNRCLLTFWLSEKRQSSHRNVP
ncbi:hypothetical protein KCV05_g205, partial [Aureobasidium melanogenum]